MKFKKKNTKMQAYFPLPINDYFQKRHNVCPPFLPQVFGTMMANIGTAGTFWTFGGCCVAATVFVLVLVFETKGKSQQEVQDILSGRRSR